MDTALSPQRGWPAALGASCVAVPLEQLSSGPWRISLGAVPAVEWLVGDTYTMGGLGRSQLLCALPTVGLHSRGVYWYESLLPVGLGPLCGSVWMR